LDIEDTKVTIRSTCEARCQRKGLVKKEGKVLGFENKDNITEADIVQEARRCIFCYDAPCSKCCPANLDVREYVHAASVKNWYYAAKVILNQNPMPLSTGCLCATEDYCSGGCNLGKTLEGPIKTSMIQTFAVRKFRGMHIKPLPGKDNGKKVAIIGSGPAGISCAVFLRRLGFAVTIFEKEAYAGGLLMSELIPTRLPAEDVEFEIQMAKDMGVEFQFNKTFGKDVTLETLKNDGFDATFLAFGRPEEIVPEFPCVGAKTSRAFLSQICGVLKLKNGEKLPDFTGKKVLVLGAGDTAMDCANAASRLGGNVTVAFRKDFKGMRAHPKEVQELLGMGVEFLSLAAPTTIENGTVTFRLQENVDGQYRALDEYITRKYDEVILAFGAKLGEGEKLLPGKLSVQKVEGHDNVFAGGDLANSVSVVEAVNDGRTAARMIADVLGVKEEIPPFHTAVDDVSLYTEFNGLKFSNPSGISSAPVSGTYECLRNCFRAGMGWAVTKTIIPTMDVQRENDFRIVKCDEAPGPSGSYANICMMTEHTCEYWLDAIRKLKAEFPDRTLVASIATSDSKERWQHLVKIVIEAGADALELNLSCPNEVHGQGGHKGGFDSENKIGMALGTHPVSVKRISEYVAEASTVPFFVKLTPNVTEPKDIARAAIEGGATGVSMINTVSGIARFWPDGTPLPQVGNEKFVLSGGLSGDQVRPIALRQIARVHNELPEIPILGIGGIGSAYTALQHLYAGSNVFQMCSAIQRFSYDICREVNSGLQFFLYSWSRPDLRAMLSHWDEMDTLPIQVAIPESHEQDRPVPTLAELRGLGAKHVVQRESFDIEWTIHAEIDQTKCLNCGKCALSCRDNSEECIHLVDGKWKVEEDKCVGCGLCLSVCPVQAMRLVESQKRTKWHHADHRDDE
jgi:dihydropyrimidine dehydrogenase (NADP+)